MQFAATRRPPLFDAEFYRTQAVGRPDEDAASVAPWKHYLKVGGFEGLDPSPGFDSDWYLARNPDVRAAGLNPLVHYVQYGLPEGRLPYHGAPTPYFSIPPKFATRALLRQRLWGGFEHLALPELSRLAQEQHDVEAAYRVASWHYAEGDVGEALKYLLPLVSRAKQSDSRSLIGLAKCYSLQQNTEALSALLARPEANNTLGEALPFVRGNAEASDRGRLSAINALLAEADLSALRTKDPMCPLALNNLTSVESRPRAGDLPLISIVMAAYNAADTVAVALESLLAQSWTSLEVIVVDDASTDGTAAVVERFAARDSRVRCLRNEYNRGAYPSRNTGMRAARGDFVTVHDSDDWSHPQKLERQMRPLLESPDKVATVSSWARVTRDLCFVGSWMLGESFLETNHSSWLMRRSVLERIGYWDNVNVAADTELLWRMEHHYGHAALEHVLYNTPLSFALSDEATLTRTKATHVKTVFQGLRRLYRESSRWWHRASDFRPVMGEVRPFPVPLGNLKRPKREYDLLVAANCAVQGAELEALLVLLRRQVDAGNTLCLWHWPDYQAWLGNPIADRVFAFCQTHSVNFAHPGLTLTAPRVIVADEALWRFPPTQTVRVEGVGPVELPNGSACREQESLRRYFLQGGVAER